MTIQNKFICAFALAVVCFSSMADEFGMTDYAKAHLQTTSSCVPFVRKYESVCGLAYTGDSAKNPVKDGKKATGPFDIRAEDRSACYGPGTTVTPPEAHAGDIISVTLQSAFIKDFPSRFFSDKGNIAIVARVAEQDSTTDYKFKDGPLSGRLVYYSGAVQKGQFLNFSQMPIYGPIEYGGKPLLMELYILQINIEQNSDLRGMLTALADLGKIAYPPASPVLNVLDRIGSGLLATKSSETVFKYHASLRGGTTNIKGLADGRAEYGNYAFVRVPNGAEGNQNWANWWFNQKNSRIYEEAGCLHPAVDNTYVVMQINKADVKASLDNNNTLQKFQSEMEVSAKASTDKKVAAIEAFKTELKLENKYQTAKALIADAASIRQAAPTRVNLAAPMKQKIDSLIDAVSASLVFTGTPNYIAGTPDYDPDQASKLAGQLYRLGDLQEFTSTLSFDPAALKSAIP